MNYQGLASAGRITVVICGCICVFVLSLTRRCDGGVQSRSLWRLSESSHLFRPASSAKKLEYYEKISSVLGLQHSSCARDGRRSTFAQSVSLRGEFFFVQSRHGLNHTRCCAYSSRRRYTGSGPWSEPKPGRRGDPDGSGRDRLDGPRFGLTRN